MNRVHALPLLALTGALLSSCSPSTGPAPVISVTANPSTVLAPGTATFTATTSGATVSRVDFYDNGALIGTDTAAPFEATRSYVAADRGVHTIAARALGTAGGTSRATTTVNVTDADTTEPNDTTATATALKIGDGAGGVIAGKNQDVDYYRFDATAGDMLKLTVKSVSVNAASTLDPYVMILLPDGKTVLEKDDDSGTGVESEIRFNVVTAGTYYVMVTSFGIHDNATSVSPIPTFADNKATNTYQVALTRR